MYRPGWCQLGEKFAPEFGARHGLPFRACHVGIDAAVRLARFVRGDHFAHCLVLSDENTFRAGGDDVCRALRDAQVRVSHHDLGGGPIDATDTLGDSVAAAAGDVDAIVAIGSGTICDLAKHAGDKLAIPVILYPTAASMNGYTSGITALKVRGLKRTISCRPAIAVFANPEHVSTAPVRMTAAGVADFLSKCSSATDWRASHILLDAPFDAKAREFFEGIQERLLDAAPRVGRGEPEAVALVLEALLLSGFSMIIAGSSAPASGGEHLISHYLDMKSAMYGTPHDLHGAQVGVATVYCLGLWEKLLALAPSDIDIDRLLGAAPKDRDVAACIIEDWGTEIGAEVQSQWDAKKMDPARLRAHLERVRKSLPRMQRELPADLLPSSAVERAIRESGGPTRPHDLTAPLAEYLLAQRRARYIRNRFTVLDLAGDLALTPAPTG